MASAEEKYPAKQDLKERGRYLLEFLQSARPHWNEENWNRIQIKKSTTEATLEKIRQKFAIPPNLKASSDARGRWVYVGEDTVDITESNWFDSQDFDKKENIKRVLETYLSKNNLPIDFYDAFFYWLLYREIPKWVAPLGFEEVFHIIDYPKKAKQIALSTADKKFLRWYFRNGLGIKSGKVPKEYANVYKELLTLVSSSKNKLRRFRSLKSSLAALKLRVQTFTDNKDEQKMTSRKTYLDLVGELNPVYDAEKLPPISKDKKAANVISQNKSRFLKRGKRPVRKAKR